MPSPWRGAFINYYYFINIRGSFIMIARTISLQLEEDISASMAAAFVGQASPFQSTIRLIAGDRNINAKSLLGVVSCGLCKGQQVEITIDGPDEADAVSALSHFLAPTPLTVTP